MTSTSENLEFVNFISRSKFLVENGKNCKWSNQNPEKLRKNEDFVCKHSTIKFNHSKDQFEEWPDFDQYRSGDTQKEYFSENPNIDQKIKRNQQCLCKHLYKISTNNGKKVREKTKK